MIKFKKENTRKKLLFAIAILATIFVGLQFIHPSIPDAAVTADFKAPQNVKSIIKRACYDCHSNETNLRWYDKIAPAYWLVADHVKKGRTSLNFSNWNSMAPTDQQAKLWEIVNQISAGAMPLKSYETVHRSAKISPNDLAVLKNYILSFAPQNKIDDTSKINTLNAQFQHKNLPPFQSTVALNGVAYIPDYKNWQVISSTERFDNGTMRLIFGNDVAVKAVRQNNTHPWPNGTTFAKVAWDQLQDNDGNLKTGAFKQVEFMIKDDQKYALTEGWGFARFKTPQLKPYGKTAMFTTECVNCHRPQKDEDFVFTQPINF